MSAQVSDTRIQIHFDIHQPIELVEMTLAFQSLAQEYQSYLSKQAGKDRKKADPRAIKLYITKIESNCILAELAGAMQFFTTLAVPIMDQAVIFSDFVKLMRDRLNYFKSLASRDDVTADEIPYTKREADRVSELTALVAKNHDGNLRLRAIKYEEGDGEAKKLLEVSFTSEEAHEIQKGAIKAREALEVKEAADYEKVLMYFYQANAEDPKASGPTGDKAVISKVTSKPLKVYILPETDQQKVRYVLDDLDHNPLKTGFVVDVDVETDVKGIPRTYRVLKIHDVIYPEPEEDDEFKEGD